MKKVQNAVAKLLNRKSKLGEDLKDVDTKSKRELTNRNITEVYIAETNLNTKESTDSLYWMGRREGVYKPAKQPSLNLLNGLL